MMSKYGEYTRRINDMYDLGKAEWECFAVTDDEFGVKLYFKRVIP